MVRCPTVAFEPDPLTAAAFERNVNLNQIADLVYESLQSETAKASFAFQRALTQKITLSRK